MAGRRLAGLAHLGIEPDIGDELSRALKAADVADRGDEGGRRDEVYPRHAHQPADLLGGERHPGEPALERLDLAVEEVDLAQTAGDGLALVGRQLERLPATARPRTPKTSLIGGRPLRFRASTACSSFFARVRWRTSAARRASRRRSARVCSSGPKTSGRNPAASSSQSVRASTLSVFTFASAIARTLRVLAITTRPTWGSSTRAICKRRPARLERHLVVGRQALGEQLELGRRWS